MIIKIISYLKDHPRLSSGLWFMFLPLLLIYFGIFVNLFKVLLGKEDLSSIFGVLMFGGSINLLWGFWGALLGKRILSLRNKWKNLKVVGIGFLIACLVISTFAIPPSLMGIIAYLIEGNMLEAQSNLSDLFQNLKYWPIGFIYLGIPSIPYGMMSGWGLLQFQKKIVTTQGEIPHSP